MNYGRATMHAVATSSYGPIDGLKVMDLPTPEPRAGQVRVAVHTAAVNPADEKTLTGTMKLLHGRSFPMVVGYDFAGVVDAVGDGVTSVSKGDAVFGFKPYAGSTKQGTFAERVVCDEGTLARRPDGCTPTQAAAVATAGATALQSLRDLGRLSTGGRVLVIGAAGGVGSLAVGVAQKLGAQVTAVCSTSTVDFVKGLGAQEVIDRTVDDPLKKAVGPFDVVFDAASAHSWASTRHLLKPGGTYVNTLPGVVILHMALSVFTSTRARFVMVKPTPGDLALLGRWVVEGMQVPVDSTFPVRDVVKGIQRMAAGGVRGRITVDVLDGW